MATESVCRVVVVDDDPSVRLMLKMMLNSSGFEVMGEAGDGGEAIGVVRDRQPDVAIPDLMMPTPAAEVLPELTDRSPATMVVVFTAVELSHDQRRELLVAGAFAIYHKGDVEELPAMLHNDAARFRRILDGEELSA